MPADGFTAAPLVILAVLATGLIAVGRSGFVGGTKHRDQSVSRGGTRALP